MAVLRLDPNVPVVWRDAFTVQLGGDPPLVVLHEIPVHEERMLAALVDGVPRAALAAIGPCSPAAVDAFLDRIAPGLAADPAPRCRFAIRARGPDHRLIGTTARALGLLGRGDEPAIQLGIVVGTHAIPLGDYRDWLRRDLPHVGVVFGDARAVVSPLVRPGRTACLRCADLWRRDADPAWPTLATQLIERPAGAMLDPILRAEALAVAARILIAGATGATGADEAAAPHRGMVLTAEGRAEQLPPSPHPECGCLLDLQTVQA